MRRIAPILVALSVWGAVTTASAKDRDFVVMNGMYGGTVSQFATGKKWQPTLWLDGTYGVAGPLHLGAYVQWLGEKFPLDNPGFGGGGLIVLRLNVKKLRLSGAFGGGYLGVPVPSPMPDTPWRHEGSGTITAYGGFGYAFIEWLGMEVRGRWMRYFRMPPGTPSHGWSIEAGLSFFYK